MKNYVKHDEWKVIEDSFVPELNRISESLFSIGNGRMGQRANFEEKYSGDSLRGSYVAGVYYPDKTRVGWWKNGYPEYFAKIINSTNWIGINILLDDEELDLAECKVSDFSRVLHMDKGLLERSFVAETPAGKQVKVLSRRFVSIVEPDAGAIEYTLVPLNFSGGLTYEPYLDLDVFNEDSNYDEKFWVEIGRKVEDGQAFITGEVKKTGFQVCTGMKYNLQIDGIPVDFAVGQVSREKYVANRLSVNVGQGQEVKFYKYAVNMASLYYEKTVLMDKAQEAISKIYDKGFDALLKGHVDAWAEKWEQSDIKIEGDLSAQQAVRFNIFQLYQTYTGEDERLNIGPKGFTGEKYGGVTYWDTEAYCLPFFMRTSNQKVARNLLVYRYKHLQKAIENAAKLGFKDGAALYPMVTINGEECHNEWEITFEEIHRNGAIAYAIYNYVNYTGDSAYLSEYGLEVLIGISRFWAQRINWSENHKKYVMLGVTGPNEYENNVNNNWYTSTIACWTMEYTLEVVNSLKMQNPDRLEEILDRVSFNAKRNEENQWQHIIDNMYLPYDKENRVFLQQDGYLDKELIPVSEIPASEKPINQHWSWDRILRSCYIKQADVLQGIYFLEDRYDVETIRRNFEFYEPLTVHESSLSPCIHSILAAKLGMEDKAYEMYVRTARLDLDDYNNDTDDGLHITSMAGTWMSIVEGFGGLRVKNNELHFSPFIPKNWDSYSFRINFRGIILKVKVRVDEITINNESDVDLFIKIHGKEIKAIAKDKVIVPNRMIMA